MSAEVSLKIMPRISTVLPAVPLPMTRSSTLSGTALRYLLTTTLGALAGGLLTVPLTGTERLVAPVEARVMFPVRAPAVAVEAMRAKRVPPDWAMVAEGP